MREMYVVGRSRDGRHLVLAPSPTGRGSHLLPIDERLDRALRGQDPDAGTDEAPRTVSPKEIQARLRAGASPEEVARDAGVLLSWVERFAGPVLSERQQVLETIRDTYLTRPRLGRSRLRIGAAVHGHLSQTAHVRPGSEAWSVYRLPDASWVLRLDVVVRGRSRRAEWSYDGQTRAVRALDANAAVLGFADPNEAAVEPAPVKRVPVKQAPVKQAPVKQAPVKQAPVTPARVTKKVAAAD